MQENSTDHCARSENISLGERPAVSFSGSVRINFDAATSSMLMRCKSNAALAAFKRCESAQFGEDLLLLGDLARRVRDREVAAALKRVLRRIGE